MYCAAYTDKRGAAGYDLFGIGFFNCGNLIFLCRISGISVESEIPIMQDIFCPKS
jgi:hypothetical protein